MKVKFDVSDVFAWAILAIGTIVWFFVKGVSDDENQAPLPLVVHQTSVSGQHDGHDYVDLGLPSGTKWATCNVGAQKTTEKGALFAWGETEPKTCFSRKNYKWWDDDKVVKYCTESSCGLVDNKLTLEPADDAATANWGAGWRMPTLNELQELYEGCEWHPTSFVNGDTVVGVVGVSKTNGETIFIPSSTEKYEVMGSVFYFSFLWASTLSCVIDKYDLNHYYLAEADDSELSSVEYSMWVPCLMFNCVPASHEVYLYHRYSGRSVRAVSSVWK